MIIQLANINESKTIFNIYEEAIDHLEQKGIFQWTKDYPSLKTVETDINENFLYLLIIKKEIVGAICLNELQDEAYKKINWSFNNKKVLVVHRLVISPKHQRNGYAKTLMDFSEHFAKENKYTSIRLDTYTQNQSAVKFYEQRNYISRGMTHFPGRKFLFHCMEKEI